MKKNDIIFLICGIILLIGSITFVIYRMFFADIWSKNADKLNRNLCKYEIKKVKAYTLEILERIYHLSGIHFIPLNQMYLLKKYMKLLDINGIR